MEYGICGGPEFAQVAADAGYDFMEGQVRAMLKPLDGDEVFLENVSAFRDAALPFAAANCFLPNELKPTGPETDIDALRDYSTTVFRRAKVAGLKTVVFGSGGARRVPDGFDMDRARGQIVEFCRMCGPLAQDNGVMLVLEPLSKEDCNIMVSVGETASIVREVDHPSVRLLVDLFHWGRDGDSLEDIEANGALFGHVHVATVANRLPMTAEPCPETEAFFGALRRGGYDGRVSIEGRCADHVDALAGALAEMKRLLEG